MVSRRQTCLIARQMSLAVDFRTRPGSDIADFPSFRPISPTTSFPPHLLSVLEAGLKENFEFANVSVVDCPDLTEAPWSLAAPGKPAMLPWHIPLREGVLCDTRPSPAISPSPTCLDACLLARFEHVCTPTHTPITPFVDFARYFRLASSGRCWWCAQFGSAGDAQQDLQL